jgi:hypothetical protein
VRFSLSWLSTEEEVRYVNEKLPLIVQRLQDFSALGKLASQKGTLGDRVKAPNGIGARE